MFECSPHKAALVFSPRSGIALEVWTTAPGMQLYSGNYLDGKVAGKGGYLYPKHGAFVLETQV